MLGVSAVVIPLTVSVTVVAGVPLISVMAVTAPPDIDQSLKSVVVVLVVSSLNVTRIDVANVVSAAVIVGAGSAATNQGLASVKV